MKIFCEYCKSAIDIEKDKKCPTCKASYLNNKEFKRMQENQAKEEQMAGEIKDIAFGMIKDFNKEIKDFDKTDKIMKKVFFSIFFIVLAFILFVFIKMLMFN